MGREVLGEFEHQVLLALLRLDADAYSAPIVEELEAATGRPIRTAAVYIVLRRLEDKGMVRSTMRSAGPDGGRDRRHFEVTAEGRRRVREARSVYLRLWKGLERELEKGQ